jgi:putative acetyltransferase
VDIRAEAPGRRPAIRALTESAFADDAVQRRGRARLVDALRAAGNLTLSLVAQQDGALVGHIAFSPVTVSDGSQRLVRSGPVSVTPALAAPGIGSALIERD